MKVGSGFPMPIFLRVSPTCSVNRCDPGAGCQAVCGSASLGTAALGAEALGIGAPCCPGDCPGCPPPGCAGLPLPP
ncbi:hypothetical protein GCM10028787_02980 [Brachybacterium horti]